MKKQFGLFQNSEKNYRQLAAINREEVDEYNGKTLSALLLLGWVLLLLPLLSAPFSRTTKEAVPAHLLAFAALFILFLLFKATPHNARLLP